MKISVVGLGLIGGSIAKSLSIKGYNVVGFDIDRKVLDDAQDVGAIKCIGTLKDLSDSDIVYICLYPEATVKYVQDYGEFFGKNTVVCDVCGIKSQIYPRLKEVAKEKDFIFIGTHPMAGREKNSFYASDSELFFGASFIIIDDQNPQLAEEIVEKLALDMGFGGIIKTSCEFHDSMIAFTSQVPHALACAYVMSPRCESHKGFSAGSYRDVSRVANINAQLWTDLFHANRVALVDELDVLLDNIKMIRDSVAADDTRKTHELLHQAAEIKKKDI